MSKIKSYRVLIFDDDDQIRKFLWKYFDRKGYEVFTFPYPASCPLYEREICQCPTNQFCSDLILSDLNMPMTKGLDFLEEQIKKGCRCNHLALMSGDLRDEDIKRAKSQGIVLFKKPFQLNKIEEWVKEVESNIPTNRRLSNWFIANPYSDKK